MARGFTSEIKLTVAGNPTDRYLPLFVIPAEVGTYLPTSQQGEKARDVEGESRASSSTRLRGDGGIGF